MIMEDVQYLGIPSLLWGDTISTEHPPPKKIVSVTVSVSARHY